MIIGIGTDIVETARIEKMLAEHGDAFKTKIFTDAELKEGETRKNHFQYFAGRWSAKEAVAKALGCGFGSKCGWRDIEIINNGEGKPELTLNGTALKTADELGITGYHVSISHEEHYACATVVAEGSPS